MPEITGHHVFHAEHAPASVREVGEQMQVAAWNDKAVVYSAGYIVVHGVTQAHTARQVRPVGTGNQGAAPGFFMVELLWCCHVPLSLVWPEST